MRTLAEVRAKFDRELVLRAAFPTDLDCVVCEDGSLSFHLSLNDGDTLFANVDAPRGAVDLQALIAALLGLGHSSALH